MLRQLCGGEVAVMGQCELSSTQWERVEYFLPGWEARGGGHVGVTTGDNRGFVNGVLCVLRSGAQ